MIVFHSHIGDKSLQLRWGRAKLCPPFPAMVMGAGGTGDAEQRDRREAAHCRAWQVTVMCLTDHKHAGLVAWRMMRLSRECQLVGACRPARYCVVCVYQFSPNPNLTGMADEAACLLVELAVLGQVPWPLAVFNQCVLMAAS